MIRFSINTLGCKVNLCESDDISRELSGLGFGKVSYSDDPDFCIINTCTVTAESDRKARQLIRRIKNESKKAMIIVTGCFTGRNMKFLEDAGIDYIINNDKKYSIPGLLSDIAGDGEDVQSSRDIPLKTGRRQVQINRKRAIDIMHSRPLIKIQDGCGQNCTYCIVPSVRGRYKSANLSDIVSRIEYIEKCGFEEIVLTGVHIGKYGVDIKSKRSGGSDPVTQDLGQLITEILGRTMIKRIRISSLEINEISKELLETIKKNSSRIAPHLHIPLQSGSNKILGSMGRPYDREYFIKKIEEIRDILPDPAITTDIMVGFPGESTGDFDQTLSLAKKLDFSKLHVFKYSPRPGTIASKMKGQVDSCQKSERSKRLRKLGERSRDDFISKNMGKRLLVICERQDGAKEILSGTSGEYIKVYFKTERDFTEIHGKLIPVRPTKKYLDGLWGDERI